jgi:hypothetical protein
MMYTLIILLAVLGVRWNRFGWSSASYAGFVDSCVDTERNLDFRSVSAECITCIVQDLSTDTAQCIARPLVTSEENSTSDTDPSDSRLDTFEESLHALFFVNLAQQI